MYSRVAIGTTQTVNMKDNYLCQGHASICAIAIGGE